MNRLGGWPTLRMVSYCLLPEMGVPRPNLLGREVINGTKPNLRRSPIRSRRKAVHSDSISTIPSTPVWICPACCAAEK